MSSISDDTRVKLAATCCERAAEGALLSRDELFDALGVCRPQEYQATGDPDSDADATAWLLLSQLVYPQHHEPEETVLRMRLGEYELVVKEAR